MFGGGASVGGERGIPIPQPWCGGRSDFAGGLTSIAGRGEREGGDEGMGERVP